MNDKTPRPLWPGMVVWSPWPVRTTVSAGSSSTEVFSDSMIVSKDANERSPVAPGPPWNRVSPEKSSLASGT